MYLQWDNIFAFLYQHPGGVFVHPSGAEKSLVDTIDELRSTMETSKGRSFGFG